MTAPTTYASTGMPFPGATGHGIRIAVVDSGVNPNHPHIIASTSGVVLDRDTNGECRGRLARSRNGRHSGNSGESSCIRILCAQAV